jgi:hypothetical protein
MDLKSIAEVAGALAGLVSTSLEIERRVSDHQLDTRAHRLRTRADELTKFLQIQMALHRSGADEQLTQQAISSTKMELDEVLQELIRVRRTAGATKVDEMSPIRRELLLFAPGHPLAWVLHFGFYFSVCFLGLSIFEIKEVLASKLVTESVVFQEIFACMVVAVFFRYWALMEKRWAEGFQPTPSAICRRLLWHRPRSRRELVARAGLVFSIFSFVPFLLTAWISLFREVFSFVQTSVTVVVFYAWSIAELDLATHPAEMKFPLNLKFLRWPQNLMTWFWTICFYFIVGCTIFFIRQVATVNILPAEYRKVSLLHVSGIVGLTIGFLLLYLLPMYALNRILLAQSGDKA